jgi:hypothetical protein
MGADLNLDLLPLYTTGHVCADCGKNIKYMEECWLLQVVQLQRINGKTLQYAVIDEDDVDGDFLFEPFFFCHECWESNYESLRAESVDEPPVRDPFEQAHFECSCCGSDIREWEYAGSMTIGEFHPSTRAPNGVRGPCFIPNCDAEPLCLHCLRVLNENFIEMWDELSQLDECADCTQIRCWRYGDNACSCSCHSE